MTKKDYELIAGSIRYVISHYSQFKLGDREVQVFKDIISTLSVDLKMQNNRFDIEKFKKATTISELYY
ncbi:MAG: hypothetical protein A2163_07975 [Actinobacteria bacterium RBG_13_35_12]|nr:MAG: hypothetical protein A2163_07975 [Actinobacteria bacterium RBG_13_35_12]